MFANLQNPMAYIIGFQFLVLLGPAFVALAQYLKGEARSNAGYGAPEITGEEHFLPETSLPRAA